jgi:hypothetical protein
MYIDVQTGSSSSALLILGYFNFLAKINLTTKNLYHMRTLNLGMYINMYPKQGDQMSFLIVQNVAQPIFL